MTGSPGRENAPCAHSASALAASVGVMRSPARASASPPKSSSSSIRTSAGEPFAPPGCWSWDSVPATVRYTAGENFPPKPMRMMAGWEDYWPRRRPIFFFLALKPCSLRRSRLPQVDGARKTINVAKQSAIIERRFWTCLVEKSLRLRLNFILRHTVYCSHIL